MIFKGVFSSSALIAAIPLATLVGSSPTLKPVQIRSSGDACADVANYWSKGQQLIPAETAFNCLTSVPFDSERALFIVDQVHKFSQIYSAQTFFANPPTLELRIKPVDLNGTFDLIRKKASSASGFANDYDFNMQLMSLFDSYHDGHVYYSPNCATQFIFYHNYPLVAIQQDGEDIPGIFVADPDSGEIGDEVAEIDGEEVHTYLEKLAIELPGVLWIDCDARWNDLLMSRHPVYGLSRGIFAWRDRWSEKSFPMKFKNGKTVEVEWFAYILHQPKYTNSAEYLQNVCLAPNATNTGGQSPTETPLPSGTQSEAPSPEIIAPPLETQTAVPTNIIGNDQPKPSKRSTPGNQNPTRHRPRTLDNVPVYHYTSNRSKRAKDREIHRQFAKYMTLRQRDDGSGDDGSSSPIKDVPPATTWPKLQLKMPGNEQTLYVLDDDTVVWGIHAFIDLAENDAFPQCFIDFIVKVLDYCQQNKKKRVLIDVSWNVGGYIALGLQTIRSLFPDAHPFYGTDMRRSPALDLLIEASANSNGSQLFLNDVRTTDGKEFSSIPDFLGPVHKYNDYFTAKARFDVEGMEESLQLNPNQPMPASPFKMDDIVLISDGRCGSTCSVFGEAISALGIKSIAINGVADEKESEKYMQHVGGVKGSQVWPYKTFLTHVENFVTHPEKYDFLAEPLPIIHTTSLNLRNSYYPGSDLPLEFTWQPANAHLYMTKDTWDDRSILWKKCAEMAWDPQGNNILQPVPKNVTNKFAMDAGMDSGEIKSSDVGTGPGDASPDETSSLQTVIGNQNDGWSFYILWWLSGIDKGFKEITDGVL